MKKINWFQLLTIIAITQLTGLISSLLSQNTREIYESLIKPPLSPPGWIFGIVWPILYLFMAIALYLVLQEEQTLESKKAEMLYWIQLFVNFIWPIVFFRLEWYWVAVIIIILLDILVYLTLVSFYRIRKLAGYLMVPYLLWIIFATYLNIGIAILN